MKAYWEAHPYPLWTAARGSAVVKWSEGEIVDGVCCVTCCTWTRHGKGHHKPLKVIDGAFSCEQCGHSYARVTP